MSPNKVHYTYIEIILQEKTYGKLEHWKIGTTMEKINRVYT